MRIDQIEDACNMMYTLLALYKGKNKQSNNTCSRHAISLYIHNMATQFLTYYKHYAYIYVYIYIIYIYIIYQCCRQAAARLPNATHETMIKQYWLQVKNRPAIISFYHEKKSVMIHVTCYKTILSYKEIISISVTKFAADMQFAWFHNGAHNSLPKTHTHYMHTSVDQISVCRNS